MEYETKENLKKLLAFGMGALVVGSGALVFELNREPVMPEVIIERINVTQPVPFIVNNTIEKEVFVNVIDESKVEYLTESLIKRDIIDDEFNMIDVFMQEDFAISNSIEFANKEIARALDKEGIISDYRKFKVLKIFSDFDDIEVISSDFKNAEYEFGIKFRVQDTKTEDKFLVKLVVKVDEDLSLVNVSKI